QIIKLFKNDYSSLNKKNNAGKNALKIAYDNNWEKTFPALLECGADPDLWTNHDGATLLHYCCYHNHPNYVRHLLKNGANIYKRETNQRGETPLHWLAATENVYILKIIKEEKPYIDLDFKDNKGFTPLHEAYFKQKLSIFKCLLKNGANPDYWKNSEEGICKGATLLHYACRHKKYEYIKSLILSGGNLYQKETSERGDTPLHWAVSSKDSKTLEVIKSIKTDVNFNIKNDRNITLLSEAYFDNDLEIFKCLLKNGANPDYWKNSEEGICKGATLLHYACRNKKYEYIKSLILSGGNLYQKENSERGYTPLHWAVGSKDSKTLEVIKSIDRYVNFNIKDNKNVTPLSKAYFNNDLETFKCLLKNGANPDFWTNNNNNTLLHFACYYGKYKFAKQLLLHGADGSRLNEADLTPLQCAAQQGYYQIVKLFKNDYSSLNKKNNAGKNALKIAYDNNRTKTFSALLATGANPDFWTDDDGETLLHYACCNNKVDFAEHLMRYSASMKINTKKNKYLPLYYAIDWNHFDIIKRASKYFRFPYIQILSNKYRKTKQKLLHHAYFSKKLEISEYILKNYDINLDSNNKKNLKILFETLEKNQFKLFKLVLDNLGFINKEYNNKFLIHEIIKKNNLDLLKDVLSKNFYINFHAKNASNQTPLEYAYTIERYDMVNLLLQKGANYNFIYRKENIPFIEKLYNDNNTELLSVIIDSLDNREILKINEIPIFHKACIDNNLNIINLLLKKGYDPQKRVSSLNNYDVLELTVSKGHNKVIDCILKEFKKNKKDLKLYKKNLLKLAYKNRQFDTIIFLITKYKFDPNDHIFGNKNLYHKACKSNDDQLIKNLLKTNTIDLNCLTKNEKNTGLSYLIKNKNNTLIEFISNFSYESNDNKIYNYLKNFINNYYYLQDFNFINKKGNTYFDSAVLGENFKGAEKLGIKTNFKKYNKDRLKKILEFLYKKEQFNIIEQIYSQGINIEIQTNKIKKNISTIILENKENNNLNSENNKKSNQNHELTNKKDLIEKEDKYGNNILHDACFNNKIEDIESLIKKASKEQLNKKNKLGHTPLLYAQQNNCNYIVELLNKKNEELNNYSILNQISSTYTNCKKNLFYLINQLFNCLENVIPKTELRTTTEVNKILSNFSSFITKMINYQHLKEKKYSANNIENNVLETDLINEESNAYLEQNISKYKELSQTQNLDNKTILQLVSYLSNNSQVSYNHDIAFIFINQLEKNNHLTAFTYEKLLSIIENVCFKNEYWNFKSTILKLFEDNTKYIPSEKFLNNYLDDIIKRNFIQNNDQYKNFFISKIGNFDTSKKYSILRYIDKNFDFDLFLKFKVEDWEIEKEIKEETEKLKSYFNRNQDLIDLLSKLRSNFNKKDLKKIIQSLNKNTNDLNQKKIENIKTYLSFKNQESLKILIEKKWDWYNKLKNNWIKDSLLSFGISFIPPPNWLNFNTNVKSISKKQITYLSNFFFKHNFSNSFISSFIFNLKNAESFNDITQFIELLNKRNQKPVEKEILNLFQEVKFEDKEKIKKIHNILTKKFIEEDCKLLNILDKEIQDQLKEIIDKGTSFDKINDFLKSLKNKNYYNKNELKEAIRIAYEYNLSGQDYNEYFKKLKCEKYEDWLIITNEFVVNKTFDSSKERSLDDLINYIYEKTQNLNPKKEIFLNNRLKLSKKDLKTKYLEIIDKYKSYSDSRNFKDEIKSNYIFFHRSLDYLNLFNKKIKDYNKEDIKIWSKIVRTTDYKPSNQEILAVLTKAVILDKGYEPRKIQMLSVLLFLNKYRSHGLIEQINTGEGKSLISAILSAFHVLKKQKVDVITSSPELVKQELAKRKSYFDLLGITYDHNNYTKLSQLKSAYKNDIVYGIPTSFVGNLIEDIGNRNNLRGNRGFTNAIVDEIDNLLYDSAGTKTLLTGSIPGMNHTMVCTAAALNFVQKIKRRLLIKDGGYYYSKKEFVFDDNGNLIPKEKSNENIYKHLSKIKNPTKFIRKQVTTKLKEIFRKLSIKDYKIWTKFEKYNLRKQSELEQICKIEDIKINKEQIDKFEKEKEIETAQLKWKQKKRKDHFKIPDYLRKYIHYKFENWVNNSISVSSIYENEKNFISDEKNNQIIHVDCNNTGVLDKRMKYSGGINLFLCMMNGLKVTPDRPLSKYLSHSHFFKKYDNLVGMTGTSGNNKLHKFFYDNYNLKINIIPPFSKRIINNQTNEDYICKELKPIVCKTKEEWEEKICRSINQKTKNGIPSLIICKYISQAKKIEKKLKEIHKIDVGNIYPYTGENSINKKFEIKGLEEGDIIIATNIAGRGTDFKSNGKIERKSGLHVCLTFLPNNKRIEKQNAGRTAREGNKGTFQYIIYDPWGRDLNELKKNRDTNENLDIENSYSIMKSNHKEDKLFLKFSKFLNELHKNRCCGKYKGKAIEERWAIWLKMNEDLIKNDYNKANKSLKKLLNEIEQDYKKGTVIKNPYFYILRGKSWYRDANRVIMENSNKRWGQTKSSAYKSYFDNAIDAFDKAIDLDPYHIATAHYYRAYVEIMQDGSNYENLNSARKSLKKAIKLTKQYRLTELNNLGSLVITKQKHNAKKQIQNLMNLEAWKIGTANKVISEIKTAKYQGNALKAGLFNFNKALKQETKNYENEIKQVSTNGYDELFGVQQVPPTNWLEVCVTYALNAVQFLAGFAMTVLTGGLLANIGFGLMYEAVGNTISTTIDALRGEFNMENWVKNKVKSLIISVTIASVFYFTGLSEYISNNSQGLNTFNLAFVSQTFKSLGIYAIVHTLGDLGGRFFKDEIIKLKKNLDPFINSIIEDNILSSLKNNYSITTAVSIDKLNGNNKWQKKILEISEELIKKHSKSTWFKDFMSVIKSIKNNCNFKENSFKALADFFITSVESGHYAKEALKYCNYFVENFRKELSKYENILEKEFNEAKIRYSKLEEAKKREIQKKNEKRNLGYVNKHLQGFSLLYYDDVKNYDSELYKTEKLTPTQYIESDAEYLCKSISQQVSGSVNSNVENGLIGTISSFASHNIANTIFEPIKKRSNEELVKAKSEARYIQQCADVSNRRLKKSNNTNKQMSPTLELRTLKLKQGSKVNEKDLAILSSMYKMEINLYDDKENRILTYGKNYKNVIDLKKVGEHCIPKNGSEIKSSGLNNCVFDALGQKLDKSGQNIRKELISTLKENPDLNSFYSSNNNKLLMGLDPDFFLPNQESDQNSEIGIQDEMMIDDNTTFNHYENSNKNSFETGISYKLFQNELLDIKNSWKQDFKILNNENRLLEFCENNYQNTEDFSEKGNILEGQIKSNIGLSSSLKNWDDGGGNPSASDEKQALNNLNDDKNIFIDDNGNKHVIPTKRKPLRKQSFTNRVN
ncbi:MAG: hypothetical protein GY830_02025, partial [Bacteroidetes bacterium]|nr:hypothetical protein [Bacteroidota bacterium]